MAEDLLNIALPPEALGRLSNLALAHVGDGVYELLVRTWLAGRGDATNARLHRDTVERVSAAAQAAAMARLLPLLTDEEAEVFRRGRNARVNSIPKHADPALYHAATGLETLFGWLFLSGRRARLNELFAAAAETAQR